MPEPCTYPLYSRAIVWAAGAHRAQGRKGNDSPYVLHPIRVAEQLRQLKQPDYVLAAAVLHDILEDTTTTQDQLLREFPMSVVMLVIGMTKGDDQTRKEYIAQFSDPWVTPELMLIKLADRLDNLREGGLDEGFTEVYRKESIRLLAAIKYNPHFEDKYPLDVMCATLESKLV